MSYGLRVKDANGGVTLKLTDRISRLVWKSEQTASSGSYTVSNIEGLKSAQFAIAINPNIYQLMPTVSRSGNVISWTFWGDSYGYFSNATCIIFVFVYT
jgi:hypothetical protein